MSQASAPAAHAAPAPRALWRHPAFLSTLAVSGAAAATAPLWWPALADPLTGAEFALARTLLPEETVQSAAWFLLPLLGLAGGLLASLSPCVLPLVPLNVAYIGAAEASGARALALSARFVLGAAFALSVLGLAGELAGWILVEQRGPVLLGVGGLLLYLGLALAELAPLPAVATPGGSRRLGPVGAGAAFALVTTPCASPILAALLAASTAVDLPGLRVVTVGAFALGYTALVFAAGVLGGALVGRLRTHSFEGARAGAAALLLAAGAGFAWAGWRWF